MVLILLIVVFLIVYMMGAFSSKEKKDANKIHKATVARWKSCYKGNIPYCSMMWYEKFLTPYIRYLRNKDTKGFDVNICIMDMLTELRLCQKEMYIEYKAGRIPSRKSDFGEWYNEHNLRSAVESALSYAESNNKESVDSFILRYIYAHECYGNIIRVMNRAHQGGLVQKRRVYAAIVNEVSDCEIRDKYLKAIELIDNDLKIIEKEKCRKEEIVRNYRIKKELEEKCDFQSVKTGCDYERFVMAFIKKSGFSCKRIGGTGDFGADIIVNVRNRKLIVQCKFYSSSVGYEAVQQAYAAKSIYKGAWCCVVSNASFTRQAKEGAKKLDVHLMSHIDIAEYLRDLK